jgi:FdhD protein
MTRAAALPIVRVERTGTRADSDLVAIEAPLSLELRSATAGPSRRVGVLMRTPGDDLDLLRGWLFTERIIGRLAEILAVDFPAPADAALATDGAADAARPSPERAVVTLASSVAIDEVVEHRVLTPTSACGLCGRLALDQLDARHGAARDRGQAWAATLIATLPTALLAAQTVFAETGGLHAAGLFDDAGRLHLIREDIGRHNAVDKVIGAALAEPSGPTPSRLLVVSGRVAFEIVQKAAVAGLTAIVAVGAPSDLAVRAARETGLTLVGFARAGRFNVYAGAQRIDRPAATPTPEIERLDRVPASDRPPDQASETRAEDRTRSVPGEAQSWATIPFAHDFLVCPSHGLCPRGSLRPA